MTVYLVIWSEQDSGYEIKGAYESQVIAERAAEALDQADRDRMIADTERSIQENHVGIENIYGRWARKAGRTAADCARESTLTYVSRPDFGQHSVEAVEVQE